MKLEVELTSIGREGASIRKKRLIKQVLNLVNLEKEPLKIIKGENDVDSGYKVILDVPSRYELMRLIAKNLSFIQGIKCPEFDESFISHKIGSFLLSVQERRW